MKSNPLHLIKQLYKLKKKKKKGYKQKVKKRIVNNLTNKVFCHQIKNFKFNPAYIKNQLTLCPNNKSNYYITNTTYLNYIVSIK